jgi:hypothetical protein
VELLAELHKENFILSFSNQNFLIFEILLKVKITLGENHHILARYVALGSYSTKPG